MLHIHLVFSKIYVRELWSDDLHFVSNSRRGRRNLPLVAIAVVWSVSSLLPVYYLPQLSIAAAVVPVSILKFVVVIPVLLLVTATIGMRIAPEHSIRLPIDTLLVLLLLLFIVSLASSLASEHPGESSAKTIYFTLTGSVVFLSTRSVLISRESIYSVLAAIVVVAAIVFVYAVVEYLLEANPVLGASYGDFVRYQFGVGRPASTLGNPVALGSYCIIVLPYAFHLGWEARDAWYSGVAKACFATGSAALVLSFTMGAWIGAAAALILVAKMRSGTSVGSLSSLFLVICTSVVLLAPLAGLTQDLPLVGRVQADLVSKGRSVFSLGDAGSYRVRQYPTAWKMLADNPWGGVGPGNYTSISADYWPSDVPDIGVRTADNMHLLLLAETGVVGGGLWTVVLIKLVLTLAKSSSSAQSREEKGRHIAAAASVTAIAVHMVFWDALYFPVIRIAFWTLAAVGISGTCMEESQNRRQDGLGE